MSNGLINLVSSYARAYLIAQVGRFVIKTKKYIEIPCLEIVKRYNESMGGVDEADHLLLLYRIRIKSKKYYHRLIFHIIDMIITNSWILYQRDAKKLSLQRKNVYALGRFQDNSLISFGLIKLGKASDTLKKGRPTASSST